jgi:hypothetical protein
MKSATLPSFWAAYTGLDDKIKSRAIGILQNDTVTWFWIGDHDDYELMLRE